MLLCEISVQDALALLAQRRRDAASVHQGSSDAHRDRIIQAKAGVEAAKQDEARERSVIDAESKNKAYQDFYNKMADKHKAETPEERRHRYNQSISTGNQVSDHYRELHGGWDGLAAVVHKYVQQAGNYGADVVTAADIHNQFPETTERTINRWLERPEFTRTARLMGRR